MATGKSTIGQILAPRLGLPFVDLDAEIVRRAGMEIAGIFAAEGEAGFRRREVEMLSALLDGPPMVLALGGGTLHHGDNLLRLRARTRLVVLDLPWEELSRRLSAAPGERPLASQAQALWSARRTGYLEAGPVVDLAGLGPQAAAAAVLEYLSC